MGFNNFIVNGAVTKNALPISAVVAASNTLTQGDVVTLTESTRSAALPADLAATKVARYVVSNIDDAQLQFNTYFETTTDFTAGEFVRLFDLRSLEGIDAVTLEAAIITGTVAVGSKLIPLAAGGWSVNAVVTGYLYYLVVQKILLNESGNYYNCSVVVVDADTIA